MDLIICFIWGTITLLVMSIIIVSIIVLVSIIIVISVILVPIILVFVILIFIFVFLKRNGILEWVRILTLLKKKNNLKFLFSFVERLEAFINRYYPLEEINDNNYIIKHANQKYKLNKFEKIIKKNSFFQIYFFRLHKLYFCITPSPGWYLTKVGRSVKSGQMIWTSHGAVII